ncbi:MULTISPECIES: YDG/SRA domain-containing protein [unclassified Pseudomonas]|uniref:YDG/SRA domain-containing protein n=1 Tax=unclassified Pseudomonas TaxID=196821 RepID=UPI00257DAEEE|nr:MULTISPECIES: YDG/SRA domain-containing protein [unclassified Pseudomonas]
MNKRRVFGHIPGTSVNQFFADRIELAKSGIHPPTQAGISGAALEGADSIVLSGGYADDEDYGDEIIYTGSGGRDQNNKTQISDQILEKTNLALAKNKIEGLPVRVTRGHKHKSEFSPEKGYQYSGLYIVDDYWREKGQAGFYIYRYKLISCESNTRTGNEVRESTSEYKENRRRESIIQRVIRDTALAKKVKSLHNYRCQVCDIVIKTSAGLYAEAAHIVPLGRPHNGLDIESNIICLCPNHHVLFDNGGFTIASDFSLIGINGKLRLVRGHDLNQEFLSYHREHCYA